MLETTVIRSPRVRPSQRALSRTYSQARGRRHALTLSSSGKMERKETESAAKCIRRPSVKGRRRSRTARSAGFLLIVAALFLSLQNSLIHAEEAHPAADLDIAFEHGLLTVILRDAPLAHVLRTIGERTDFRVVIRGDFDVRVTDAFAGVPADKGVLRLAGDHTLVLVYAPRRHAAEAERLAEVYLYWYCVPRRQSLQTQRTHLQFQQWPEEY